jgi:hypothetical protein
MNTDQQCEGGDELEKGEHFFPDIGRRGRRREESIRIRLLNYFEPLPGSRVRIRNADTAQERPVKKQQNSSRERRHDRWH